MWTEGHFAGTSVPSEDLYEEIETLLNAHPNWEHAGELIISSYVYQTWRCIGVEDENGSGSPGNSHGEDFYLVFRYHENGVTDHLRIGAAEGYDHANGNVIRPCVNVINNNTAPASDGSYGGGAGYAISHANNCYKHQVVLSEIYDYWILVANDGVYVGSRVGVADYGVYAGLFESLMDVDPFPLVVSNILSTISNNWTTNSDAQNLLRGYWSRHPGNQASDMRNWKVSHPSWNTWTTRIGQIANYGDLFHGGRVVGTRCAMRTIGMGNADSLMEVFGCVRGLWRYLLNFNVPTGVVIGDRITIEGDEYHYCGGNNTHVWINRDAE